jgi:hypothetical protein
MLPSHFFRRSVVLSFQEDAIGIRLRDVIGRGEADCPFLKRRQAGSIVLRSGWLYRLRHDNSAGRQARLLADAPYIRFEWDDAKNDRCVGERGFGFADILPAFLDPNRRVERDGRRDYGEERFRLYGRVAGRLFVIAYTRRETATRIISARKANARERDRYGAD